MESLAWFLVLALAGISFSSFAYRKFKDIVKTYEVPRPIFFILVGLSIIALAVGGYLLYMGTKDPENPKEISYYFLAFITVGSGFYHLLSALRNYFKWRSHDEVYDPDGNPLVERHDLTFDFSSDSDSSNDND